MNLDAPKSKVCGLAPMEGVTDFPTRAWFRFIGGMDFLWTPFLRVTDTFPARFPEVFVPEIFSLKGLFATPTIVQVMGSNPEHVVRTAEILGDRVNYVDLNCGCPSPTVVGSRAGSSLLERVELFSSFVEFVSNRLGPERLSVKMRTGFQSDKEFDDLLGSIKSFPLHHLTVHGRSRPQRYTGTANWSVIETAARTCPFPIIGSGDIGDTEGLALRVSPQSQVQGVIVGRGALRNPWIFLGRNEAPVAMALLLFVVMQDVYLANPEILIRWVADEPIKQLNTADEFWCAAERLISRRGSHARAPHDVESSPRALSRGKMLWNYLRSSLPEAFMLPDLMRSRSLSDLILGISEISRQSALDPANLPIYYHRDRDWMFSGEGRGVRRELLKNVGQEKESSDAGI